MADIDQIIAGGAGASSRADFSGIADIPKYYWEAKDQRAKNDLRDAFKGGVPMKDGQPDWGAVAQTFFQKGAIDQGIAAANQALAQQKLLFGQEANKQAFPEAPAQPAASYPPSANRPGGIADPAYRREASTAQPAPQPATPLPPDQQQSYEPGAPVRMPSPQAVQDWRNSVPLPQVAQAPQPQIAQAPQQPAPDFNSRFSAARPGQGSDPTLGGLVPVGRTAQQQVDLLSQKIGSGLLNPDQAKAYQSRIEAITKAIEPTGTMKEYDKAVQQGFKGTLEDWQNRTDENTTQRDVLTKSLIPRIEKSQEKATAARDDIDTLHRARAELDRPGGIFSGVLANKKLDLAKAGELFGFSSEQVANTEAFRAAAGQRVASLIKAFGSGTAISDGDRKFTQDIAAGNITLDEKSIRRLFDVGEKAGRLVIERHNEFADKAVKANEGLKASRDTLVVKAPDAYKKAVGRGSTFASPADVRSAIAAGSLQKGDTFVDGNGKTRVVP